MKRSTSSLLYVEDDAIVRDIMCSIIAARYPAVSIDSAGSADEGVDLFKIRRHAIVMTDINLINSSGISMVRAIRRKAPETVVIFITGSSDLEPLAEFEKTGPSHVIRKPAKCEALFRLLDRYLIGCSTP